MPHGCGLLEALHVRPMGLQGRALASLRRSARNRDHIPQWGRGGGTVYTVVSHSAFPATPCEYEYTTQSLLTSHFNFSLSLCFSTLVYRVKFNLDVLVGWKPSVITVWSPCNELVGHTQDEVSGYISVHQVAVPGIRQTIAGERNRH